VRERDVQGGPGRAAESGGERFFPIYPAGDADDLSRHLPARCLDGLWSSVAPGKTSP